MAVRVNRDVVVRTAVWGTVIVLAVVVFSRAAARRARTQGLALGLPTASLALPGRQPDATLELKQRSQEALLTQPWGRDPFSASDTVVRDEPADLAGSATEDLVLTGVLTREGRKVAIINHFFVREGESLDGSEVVRIEQDRVLVKRNGDEIVLRMRPV